MIQQFAKCDDPGCPESVPAHVNMQTLQPDYPANWVIVTAQHEGARRVMGFHDVQCAMNVLRRLRP